MSTKPDTSAASDKESLGLGALARRRALLSGLGKGGAVLAAASKPIQSLAGTGGSTVLVCQNGTKTCYATVSGCASAVHSVISGGGVTQVNACGGSPKYWCNATTWPTGCNKTTTKYVTATTFYSCFGYPPQGGSNSTTLYDCMVNANNKYGTDAPVWCAAYLNGKQYYQGGLGVYPYPHDNSSLPKAVKTWYTDTQKSNALALFKLIQKDSM